VKRDEPAPLLTPRGASQLINGKYIVKFKDGMSIASVDKTVSALSSKADRVYNHIFRGFAGNLNANDLKTLRDHPDVSPILILTPAPMQASADSSPGRVH